MIRNQEKYKNNIPKPMVIILDNNPLSIGCYAEEYPENWKKICEVLDKNASSTKPQAFNHIEGISYPNKEYLDLMKGCGKYITGDFGGQPCGTMTKYHGLVLCPECRELTKENREKKE